METSQGRHNASDTLKVLSRKQLLACTEALEELVNQALETLQEAQGAPEESNEDSESMKQLGEAVLLLQGAALIAHGILQVCHSSLPDNLLTIASTLHDSCLLVSNLT